MLADPTPDGGTTFSPPSDERRDRPRGVPKSQKISKTSSPPFAGFFPRLAVRAISPQGVVPARQSLPATGAPPATARARTGPAFPPRIAGH